MTSINETNLRYGLLGPFTTSATANTETSHAHGLVGAAIVAYSILITGPASATTVYESKTPDSTNLYVKPSTALAMTFKVIIFYYGGQA